MRAFRSLVADPSERAITLRWAVVFLALSAVFLASDIALHPIVCWDESRLAVNAIEMSQRGFSLVTTYAFRPDLWNTKPPLLIWLEAGSIDLFGPSEWALRLPSLLAALATVGIVMRFSWRLSRSRFVTLAAPFMLVCSPGFFGTHAAQSGDYESLLCLLVTAYLLLLFELLHRRRPHPRQVVACALLIAAACLTKGIAGLVPGAGVLAYVLVRGRWPRLFKTPWYAAAGLVVLAIVGGYYLLREQAAPGYLAAVMNNELSGRYLHGMHSHVQSPYYYLKALWAFFVFGPALIFLLAAIFRRWKPSKSAAFVAYANYVAIAMLLVYSLGGTKIYWYIVPLYPMVSISLAIVAERGLAALARPPLRRPGLAQAAVVLAAAYAIVTALLMKFVLLPPLENTPQSRYGMVFAQLGERGLHRIRTIDGGVYNDDDLVDYTPQRHFYTLAWRERGLDIQAEDPHRPASLGAGEVLVTCDRRYAGQVAAFGASLTTVPDCVASASVAEPQPALIASSTSLSLSLPK